MEDEQFSFFEPIKKEEKEDLKALKKELEELRKTIEYHNRLYYELDEPEISDYEYDQLTQRLRKIETEHPELITSSSP